jgi:hypothetical protein
MAKKKWETFVDVLRQWLEMRNDPRLKHLTNGEIVIERVCEASADFCEFMAQQVEEAEKREAK